MKHHFLAAGALLLGSSAVALAADTKIMSSVDAEAAKLATGAGYADTMLTSDKPVDPIWAKSLVAGKSEADLAETKLAALGTLPDKATWSGDGQVHTATATEWKNSLASAKLQTAAWDGGDKWQSTSLGSDAKLRTAAWDGGDKWSSTPLDGDAKLKTAAWDGGDKWQSTSLDGDAKLRTAAWEGGDKWSPTALDGDDKLRTASLDSSGKFDTMASADPKLQLAAATDAGMTKPVGADDYAVADKSSMHQGMGGPDAVDGAASAMLTPQPATMNYPACEPGPGDDRCIQLYETGVREHLASWNRPTGGLLDDRSVTAMGGPLEPLPSDTRIDSAAALSADMSDGKSTELAMNDGAIPGHGAAGAAIGPTGSAMPADLAHQEAQGMGGPVEAQSGYPPCSQAGPGEDRCIQLYEAGVTGAGN